MPSIGVALSLNYLCALESPKGVIGPEKHQRLSETDWVSQTGHRAE